MRKNLPGEIVKHFRATTTIVRTQRPATLDSMSFPQMDVELTTEIHYLGTLKRLDGNFTLHLEWVDVEGGGHRVELPHEVVNAITSAKDRITAQARSEGAQKAVATKKANGWVPTFQKAFEA